MRAVLVVLIALGGLVAACGGEATTLPPMMPVQCQGIPAQTCQEIVNDARRNADPGTIPLQIRAVCTSTCTLAAGDVNVDILYSNNRRDSYSMGWSGAAAPPPGGPATPEPSLPVEPACTDVPAGWCHEQALAAWGSGPPADGTPQVTRIEVRCTSRPCTATLGKGDTIFTYDDGTTSTTSWDYAGEPPAET